MTNDSVPVSELRELVDKIYNFERNADAKTAAGYLRSRSELEAVIEEHTDE